MKLHDYFLDTKVKVFGHPCEILYRKSKELNDVELLARFDGGDLRSFNIGDTVPFATPYNYYGKNFIILHFLPFKKKEYVPQIIFIRDGKFFDKKDWDTITNQDMDGISLVVDRFGRPLNIEKLEDISNFINETWDANEQFDILYKKYLTEYNIGDFMNDEYCERYNNKKITREQFENDCEKAEIAQNKAASQSINVAENKWYTSVENEKFQRIYGGYEFGFVYTHLKNEHNHQWEKQKAIELLKNRYAEKYNNSLNEYIKWVKNNNIDVEENDIREVFELYDIPMKTELEEDYMNSEQYKSEFAK